MLAISEIDSNAEVRALGKSMSSSPGDRFTPESEAAGPHRFSNGLRLIVSRTAEATPASNDNVTSPRARALGAMRAEFERDDNSPLHRSRSESAKTSPSAGTNADIAGKRRDAGKLSDRLDEDRVRISSVRRALQAGESHSVHLSFRCLNVRPRSLGASLLACKRGGETPVTGAVWLL